MFDFKCFDAAFHCDEQIEGLKFVDITVVSNNIASKVVVDPRLMTTSLNFIKETKSIIVDLLPKPLVSVALKPSSGWSRKTKLSSTYFSI